MPQEFNFNTNDYNLIAETTTGTFGGSGDYIRLTIRYASGDIIRLENDLVSTPNGESPREGIFYSGSSDIVLKTPGQVGFAEEINLSTGTDFPSYYDNNGNIYIKPNEILEEKNLQTGNYGIKLDYLNQFKPSVDDSFIITQVSPSRLEARIKF